MSSRIDEARRFLVGGDIAGARRACEPCLAAPADKSDLAAAHLILAACCRREGKLAPMIAHAESAVAAMPEDALAHYALAECVDET
jgi:hypothetical protein